ncbi:MAG: hypothetical protein EZS26_000685 [Candidatus Ordinivivax streblomastigis]|uniref:Uncharacterized protein n=1 Tax=Candidatus Ordinivivax streblomastigis TaxID=2540710 RepID=A0A5M8P423_9BACT|nr:MAG: hypothetical protein EZS26_000685 [Candidatus Ordinivivax streblomastigis]
MKNIKTQNIFRFLIAFFLFFSVAELYAQTEKNSKYIVWFSPSKATDIYGIRFNVLPIENEIPSHIFGIELNICPIVVGTFGMAVPYFFMKSTYDIRDDNLSEINFGAYKKVYGLQIGPLSYEPSVICGLDINLMSIESKVHGITVSCFTGQHDVVNGFAISAIGNNDIQCNGAQVGLFNTCSDLRGFQFGLWNKNQKRALPIINWNFSKKTNKTPAYPE